MSTHLQVISITIVITYFGMLVHFVKQRTLAVKYTLLWLGAGLGIGIVVLFPGILKWIALLLDIKLPVNALFFIGIFFIVVILFSLTAIVSKQTERIRELAQYNAMLEKRIRELEIEKK